MRRFAVALALTLAPQFAAAAPAGWDGDCQPDSCLFRRPAREGTATLLVAKRPGADGLALGFAFTGANADRNRPVALGLDGRAAATLRPPGDIRPIEQATELWVTGAQPLARLAQQIKAGKELRLSYLDILGAPHDATFDLTGWGEIVATMAVGDVDQPRTVAPVPRSDLVLPERIDEIRRLGVPERLRAIHARMTACEALDSPRLADHPPLIAEISPTALLYALPCTAGRDTLLSKLWVVELGEIGGVMPQSFALYQPRQGWTGADLLPNVAWDKAMGRLTARAEPAGGCAWSARWGWRGTVFGLDELTLAPCDGRRTPARIVPSP